MSKYHRAFQTLANSWMAEHLEMLERQRKWVDSPEARKQLREMPPEPMPAEEDEEIEAECPVCGDGVSVFPDETETQCDHCLADISITRNPDGGVSLSSDDEGEVEDDWEIPKKLYHGTSLKRFKEMLASLKTSEPLYLADSVSHTQGYAENATADDESAGVTVVFDTEKLLATGQLGPDWDDVETMIGNGETNDEGDPLFDTYNAQDVSWIDSLRIINTCSYEGDLSGAIIEVLLDNKVVKPPFDSL